MAPVILLNEFPLPINRLPVILPAALTSPPVKKLLPVIVPVDTKAFVPCVNVNPPEPARFPLSL